MGAGLVAIAVAAVLSACYQEPVAIRTFPPERTVQPTSKQSSFSLPTIFLITQAPHTPEPTAGSPTPLPLNTPSHGPLTPSSSPASSLVAVVVTPSPGCVDGWIGPVPGDPEYEEGIAILSGFMGIEGQWNVLDIRYFSGPEVPWIFGNPNPVERWYLRAGLVDDPTFRGRWILEKRSEDILGVSAVAPWESAGYESPDWTGFVGEGEPQNYLGLPGQWSGIPYDFVTGENDSGNPGLPDEVLDCLSGT
ncbi:MAG: hypothetical protein ABIP53_01325 [Candidatus Limnocylindrales bacterium]